MSVRVFDERTNISRWHPLQNGARVKSRTSIYTRAGISKAEESES
jgi:hypothetical protein